MRTLVIVIISLWTVAVCCSEKPLIAVSIVPQKFFVQRIAGDGFEVSVMITPGQSPAVYEPKPRQMAQLSKTGLFFSIGVPSEKHWLPRLASLNPEMRIVDCSRGIERIAMKSHHHDETEHAHDQKGDLAGEHKPGHHHDPHSHDGIKDPHVWLSPVCVMRICRNMLTALSDSFPEKNKQYYSNYADFMEELTALDLELLRIFSKGNSSFMVFHPAWGYLARDYGLEQIPVELEGKEPGPKDIQGFIEMGRKHGIKVIFVQPQISSRSARIIAESIDAKVLTADPLAENWIQNLKAVAGSFSGAG